MRIPKLYQIRPLLVLILIGIIVSGSGCMKVDPSPMDTSQGGVAGLLTLVASGDGQPASTSTSTSVITITIKVSGLSGSGLVLTNNGADDLAVTGDGDYQFSSPLSPGESYDIAVKTQPSSPAQTCSVTNGTGTASASTAINITITCVTDSVTVTQVAVGGTVSGLAGTGLVLQNNGGDDLSVTANGSFTFSTSVNEGDAYNVTVLTRPSSPAQTCSVTNGSGTASTIDITDISITCTTDTVTIGLTISGLSGTGMVLQNNGGDDLSISSSGSASFSTPVSDGDTYNVTILTAPGTPPQTCSITGGSGTASSSTTVNVTISCSDSTWTTAIATVTPGTGASAFATGIDDSQRAHLVYVANTGSGDNTIRGRYYQNGSWGTSDILDFTATGAAFSGLDFAINGDGKGVVVANSTTTPMGLFAAIYDPSTGWPSLSNVYSTNSCSPLYAIMWSAGDGMVTCATTSQRTDVAFDTASAFGSPVLETMYYNNGNYDVGYSPAGYVGSVSSDGSTVTNGDYLFRGDTAWTDITGVGGMNDNGSIAINSSGQILLGLTSNADISVYSGAGSGVTYQEMVGGSSVGFYDTVLDDNNNGFLFWSESGGSTYKVNWSYYKAGSIQTSTQNLFSTTSGYIQKRLATAMNPSGHGFVAWIESDGFTTVTVYVARFDTNTGTVDASPTTVYSATFSGDASLDIDVAINASGRGVVAFRADDGVSPVQLFTSILE